jgi:hypothetical protein
VSLALRRNPWPLRAAAALILLGAIVIFVDGSSTMPFVLGSVLLILGVLAIVLAGAGWKARVERLAIGLITFGIVMIVQGFQMGIYGTGFVVVIAGTVVFIVVSHL